MNMRKTKIICTLGPAVDHAETIERLIRTGMNAARFNFSHGSHAEQLARLNMFKKVRDTLGAPVATILADSYFECQNQLALTGHFFDVQALLINQSLWESMSPELQQVIQQAALEAQQVTRDLIAGGEEADIETLKSKGMNVTTPDKQSFVDKMGPAYEEIASLCGQDELDNLMAAVEAARESA